MIKLIKPFHFRRFNSFFNLAGTQFNYKKQKAVNSFCTAIYFLFLHINKPQRGKIFIEIQSRTYKRAPEERNMQAI
jgi:hypothetical protein